jgi:hypothetical protein
MVSKLVFLAYKNKALNLRACMTKTALFYINLFHILGSRSTDKKVFNNFKSEHTWR